MDRQLSELADTCTIIVRIDMAFSESNVNSKATRDKWKSELLRRLPLTEQRKNFVVDARCV